MTTYDTPRSAEDEVQAPAPSPGGDAPSGDPLQAPPARLRRLGVVWLGVAIAEALLYVLVYRSPTFTDLYAAPALLVFMAGAFQSWRTARPRTHQDRRHGDRRHGERRD
jgi:hypothetical protein